MFVGRLNAGSLVTSSPSSSTRALGGLLEARDHAERRGLPAAGRAEHGEELAARDVELHLAHGREVPEALGDAVEPDARVSAPVWTSWLMLERQPMAEP